MHSSQHEYESVSETDIQMNQFEISTEAAINYLEDEEEEVDDDEEEEVLNSETPPSLENDVEYASEYDAHSHLVASGNYSSLVGKPTTHHQHFVYSQLGAQENVLPVVPQTYYNIP